MRGSWTSGSSHRRNQMLMEDPKLLIRLKGSEVKKGVEEVSDTVY